MKYTYKSASSFLFTFSKYYPNKLILDLSTKNEHLLFYFFVRRYSMGSVSVNHVDILYVCVCCVIKYENISFSFPRCLPSVLNSFLYNHTF